MTDKILGLDLDSETNDMNKRDDKMISKMNLNVNTRKYLDLNTTQYLGKTITSWNYPTYEAYFKCNPMEHINGKTLVGLFYEDVQYLDVHSIGSRHDNKVHCIGSRDDNKVKSIGSSDSVLRAFPKSSDNVLRAFPKSSIQLLPLPVELAHNEILQDIINLYDKEFLDKYNTTNIPLEDKQFVLLVGGGEKLVNSFRLSIHLTLKEYTNTLVTMLNFWNKYFITQINSHIKNAIDHFISYIISENDVFWGNLKDDLTNSLKNRRFKVDDITPTDDNRNQIKKMREIEQRHIHDMEAQKKLLNDAYGIDFAPKCFVDGKSKYVDVSEFLMKPLPREEYYSTIDQESYNTIFLSCTQISRALTLRLFAAICCSYRFFHLNLSETILDAVNRLKEPVVVSLYTRYLLYLAYKEETIYKTYSSHVDKRVKTDVHRNIKTDVHGGIKPDVHGDTKLDTDKNIKPDEHGNIKLDISKGIKSEVHGDTKLDVSQVIKPDVHESVNLDTDRNIETSINDINISTSLSSSLSSVISSNLSCSQILSSLSSLSSLSPVSSSPSINNVDTKTVENNDIKTVENESTSNNKIINRHRHIIPQNISSKLTMIITDDYAQIIPANGVDIYPCSLYNNSELHITLSRGVYNSKEFKDRLHLFTRGRFPDFKAIKLPAGAKVYVTGSIMTACGLKVPRKLSGKEKEMGKISTATGGSEVKWYKKCYKNSDIDIAIYTRNFKSPDGFAVPKKRFDDRDFKDGKDDKDIEKFCIDIRDVKKLRDIKDTNDKKGSTRDIKDDDENKKRKNNDNDNLMDKCDSNKKFKSTRDGVNDKNTNGVNNKDTNGVNDKNVININDKDMNNVNNKSTSDVNIKDDKDQTNKIIEIANNDTKSFNAEVDDFFESVMAIHAHITREMARKSLTLLKRKSGNLVKLIKINNNKYRIKCQSMTLELFRMYYDNPCGMIYNFHMPCVRAFYDPYADEIYNLPSYVYAGLTGYLLDYRYFASDKTQLDIIYKNAKRGFSIAISRDEKDTINKMYSVFGDIVNNRSEIMEIIFYLYDQNSNIKRHIGYLNHNIDFTRYGDILDRIVNVLYSLKRTLFIYSVEPRLFWNCKYRRINRPSYPSSTELNMFNKSFNTSVNNVNDKKKIVTDHYNFNLSRQGIFDIIAEISKRSKMNKKQSISIDLL